MFCLKVLIELLVHGLELLHDHKAEQSIQWQVRAIEEVEQVFGANEEGNECLEGQLLITSAHHQEEANEEVHSLAVT